VRLSLELQRAFGLRREEALKFRPSYADRGDHLLLKASWTKGGKARQIPIRTSAQRAVLDRVWQLAGSGSLIPSQRSFIQQLRVYVRQIMNAGLSKMHGLRHAYAQNRYFELTGWKCPVAGGPKTHSLSPNDRRIDKKARLTITRELGHVREQIVSIYIGR
jgi:integrase